MEVSRRAKEDEMNAVMRRSTVSPLTELFDWFESGWPMVADWRREGGHALRIEDRLEDDRYVVRAEIPGIDPDKDVEITVSDGVLTISAERREEISEKGRSEFHYGSLIRAGLRCRRVRSRTRCWPATRTASWRSRCRSRPCRSSRARSRSPAGRPSNPLPSGVDARSACPPRLVPGRGRASHGLPVGCQPLELFPKSVVQLVDRLAHRGR